jgi:hypothetical protein
MGEARKRNESGVARGKKSYPFPGAGSYPRIEMCIGTDVG